MEAAEVEQVAHAIQLAQQTYVGEFNRGKAQHPILRQISGLADAAERLRIPAYDGLLYR